MSREVADDHRRQTKMTTADHRRSSAMIAIARPLMILRSQSKGGTTVRGSWRRMETPVTTTTLRGDGSVARPYELVTQPRRGRPVVTPLRPHPNEHHDGFRKGVVFYAEDALAFAPMSVMPGYNSRGEIGPQCFDVVDANGSDIAVVVYAPNAALNAHYPGGGTIHGALSELWHRAFLYGDINAPSARSGSEQGTSQAKLTLGLGVMAGKGRGSIIIDKGALAHGRERTALGHNIFSRSPTHRARAQHILAHLSLSATPTSPPSQPHPPPPPPPPKKKPTHTHPQKKKKGGH